MWSFMWSFMWFDVHLLQPFATFVMIESHLYIPGTEMDTTVCL